MKAIDLEGEHQRLAEPSNHAENSAECSENNLFKLKINFFLMFSLEKDNCKH